MVTTPSTSVAYTVVVCQGVAAFTTPLASVNPALPAASIARARSWWAVPFSTGSSQGKVQL
jgi:hypothetical protein